MLTIYATEATAQKGPAIDGEVIFPTRYVLHCVDEAQNKLEIETNKETYLEVSDFLDKLKAV